jgi:uncharacterized membrane protein YbhN (UPF0104 family)
MSKQAPIKRGMAQWVGTLVGAVIVCFVVVIGYRLLHDYRWDDVAKALSDVPLASIARSAVFVAASYTCLTFFDWIALRCIDRPLAWPQAALASFTSLSIGHNVGFAGLSSGAVRYRFYSRWGLSFEDVAKLVVFCGITVALGLATTAGCSLLLNPALASSVAGVSPAVARLVGMLLLVIPSAYVGLTRFRSSLAAFGRTVKLPSTKLALAQIGIGSLNYLSIAACLHQLLGTTAAVGYFDVATAYVLANTGVIASHVPGGIGVLEGIMLSLLPGVSVLAALLIFRVLYYLVPLALGLTLFLLSEVVLKPGHAWKPQKSAKALHQP